MRVALFLLISGYTFWVGLGLLAVGAALGLFWRGPGVPIALAGILLAAVSAVPLHAFSYGVLAVAFALWLAGLRRSSLVRRIATAMLVVVVLLISAAVALQESSVQRQPSDARPVFVLGDSLSAGLSGHADATWPNLLANRIGRPVTSFARPGARLADGLGQAEALPASGCVVVIELGGNDLLGGATVESFADSLRRLLRRVATGDRSVFMFELPLLPFQNQYGQIQRQVSSEFGVRLIPRRVLAGAVAWPGHTTDGLHLSATGHEWLAQKMAGWL